MIVYGVRGTFCETSIFLKFSRTMFMASGIIVNRSSKSKLTNIPVTLYLQTVEFLMKVMFSLLMDLK